MADETAENSGEKRVLSPVDSLREELRGAKERKDCLSAYVVGLRFLSLPEDRRITAPYVRETVGSSLVIFKDKVTGKEPLLERLRGETSMLSDPEFFSSGGIRGAFSGRAKKQEHEEGIITPRTDIYQLDDSLLAEFDQQISNLKTVENKELWKKIILGCLRKDYQREASGAVYVIIKDY